MYLSLLDLFFRASACFVLNLAMGQFSVGF